MIDSLNNIRKEIDKIDLEILSLFERRMDLAKLIADHKLKNNLSILDRARESEKLGNIKKGAKGEYSDYAERLFSLIMELSREEQKRLIDKNAESEEDTRLRVLIINGPNLNLLGIREPEIYGSDTYDDLEILVHKNAQLLNITAKMIQSNCEGEIVNAIQGSINKYDAIIINPAAYTHTSIAILDALRIMKSKGVKIGEVHISDISKREGYRKHSFVSEVADFTITGEGINGYKTALNTLCENCENLNDK